MYINIYLFILAIEFPTNRKNYEIQVLTNDKSTQADFLMYTGIHVNMHSTRY